MSTRLALYLLGSPRIELNHAPVSADRRKSLALLAYLALNPGTHTRDLLSAMFWPEYDQDKAFTNLRHLLWETQQALGEGWVVSTRETLALAPTDSTRTLWLDVEHFNGLLAESRAQSDPALRLSPLLDATKLYRNHFLTGFSLKDAPAFNEWANATAEELRQKLAEALTLLSTDYGTLGQFEQAIPHAQRLVSLDPLNETAHRQLMTIYLQAGQPNAALKQYQACEKLLRKELGLDPQPETRELYKQIRKGDVKPSSAPAAKEAFTPQHNLPSQVSKFIGREKEMHEVTSLVKNNRLVTLTGIGGIGKTRLALKVAEQYLLNEYPHGVWFVELATLNDPALVPQTVARLFHLMEQTGETLTDKLLRVLKTKTTLLILDNCEHLLDACAQLTDTLLKHCPSLKILATSREALGITGEARYNVSPLALPNMQKLLENLLGYEAIQLFEERAQLVNKNFALTIENAPSITQICQRLDGMPLAIELAAARVNILSTAQIAARLDESFTLLAGEGRAALPRHQTLHASIDWSWNLLSEPEQVLLRRLSIFSGGWTLEIAEAVCAGGLVGQEAVLGLLGNLVEKSLVLRNSEDGRYNCLEVIRQYAYGKLRQANEIQFANDQRLAWVLTWAETLANELEGRNQISHMQEVALEVDNVRSALEWGLSTNQAESSLRLYIALRYFLDGHTPYYENRRWLEAGLALRDQLTQTTLAKTLVECTWLAFRQNDPNRGIQYGHESIATAKELGDRTVLADALRSMGTVQVSQGSFHEAILYFEEARSLYQTLGNTRGVVMAVSNHALALNYQGEVPAAIQLLEAHLPLLNEISDTATSAWFQFALGGFKVLQGEVAAGEEHLKSALRLYRQLHNVYFIGNCIVAFAGAAHGQGQLLRAVRLFGAREAIHDSIGAKLDSGLQLIYASLVTQARATLATELFESTWAEGRALTLDEAIEYALYDA